MLNDLHPHGLHDEARGYIAADPTADIFDALHGKGTLPSAPTMEQWVVATVDRRYNRRWWTEEANRWYLERFDADKWCCGPKAV